MLKHPILASKKMKPRKCRITLLLTDYSCSTVGRSLRFHDFWVDNNAAFHVWCVDMPPWWKHYWPHPHLTADFSCKLRGLHEWWIPCRCCSCTWPRYDDSLIPTFWGLQDHLLPCWPPLTKVLRSWQLHMYYYYSIQNKGQKLWYVKSAHKKYTRSQYH